MDFFSFNKTTQEETKDDNDDACSASPTVSLPDKAKELRISSVGSFDTAISSSSSSTSGSSSTSEEGVEWTLAQSSSSYDDDKNNKQQRQRKWLWLLIGFSILMLGAMGGIVIVAVSKKQKAAAAAAAAAPSSNISNNSNLLGGGSQDGDLPQQQQNQTHDQLATSQQEEDGQGGSSADDAEESEDDLEGGGNGAQAAAATSTPTATIPTTTAPTFQPTLVPTLAPTTFRQGTVTMYAMGDFPYNANQAVLLQRYMQEIPTDDNAAFVVHVGDMRSAATSAPCRWGEYANVADLLALSPAPVFMLIGDNDVHDCPDRMQGLEYWETNLGRFWEHWNNDDDDDAAAIGQVSQLADVPGTWTFVHDQVLFIGVHLTQNVSPHVGLQTAWCIHLIQQYVQDLYPYTGRVVLFSHAGPDLAHHQTFFDDLSDFFANELDDSLPLLSVQGNTHVWDVVPSWYYGRPSWMKITVEGEAREAPTRLSISSSGAWQEPADAFQYTRRW